MKACGLPFMACVCVYAWLGMHGVRPCVHAEGDACMVCIMRCVWCAWCIKTMAVLSCFRDALNFLTEELKSPSK